MQDLEENSLGSRLNPLSDQILIGKPLGKFRLKIITEGFHKEIEGELFDATNRFLNRDLVRDFKTVVCDDIRAVKNVSSYEPIYEETLQQPELEQTQKNESETKEPTTQITTQTTVKNDFLEHLNRFRSFPLNESCRILVLDEIGTRLTHIIVQVGRLEPLIKYATVPDRLSKTVLHGQRVTYQVSGEGMMLPTKRQLPDGLGAGFIYWFIPDGREEISKTLAPFSKVLSTFSEIVPFIHQTVKVKMFKKMMEAQVQAKEEALKDSGNIVKAKSVENDGMFRVLHGLTRHNDKPMAPIKQHDFYDFISYFLPWIVFSLIGWSIGDTVGTVFGGMIGLVIGAFFNYRRR